MIKDMTPGIARELGENFIEATGQIENLHHKVIPFPMNHSGKLGKLFW